MTTKPILLVEDDPDIQENLRFFLESEGFAVQSASNGFEALEYLRAGNSARVILLDLMMPVMDGYEFMEKLDAADPGGFHKIPIVVLSAVPDIDRIARERKIQYVKKPIDLDRLLAVIAAKAS